MELTAILPFYFGTRQSNPPRHGETLATYLDRLMAEADRTGDLALLQRVLSVKVALFRQGHPGIWPTFFHFPGRPFPRGSRTI